MLLSVAATLTAAARGLAKLRSGSRGFLFFLFCARGRMIHSQWCVFSRQAGIYHRGLWPSSNPLPHHHPRLHLHLHLPRTLPPFQLHYNTQLLPDTFISPSSVFSHINSARCPQAPPASPRLIAQLLSRPLSDAPVARYTLTSAWKSSFGRNGE